MLADSVNFIRRYFACFIGKGRGPVSVANCREVFDKQGNPLDEKVEKRVRRVAKNLVDCIEDNICPKISLEAIGRGNMEYFKNA